MQALGTEVLAISTDSIFAHQVFIQGNPALHQVQYPILSDRTQKISKAYQVLDEQSGASFRCTVIIDPHGIMVAKMVYPDEVGRNTYEILRFLQAIQYARAKGEGVPANWVPAPYR